MKGSEIINGVSVEIELGEMIPKRFPNCGYDVHFSWRAQDARKKRGDGHLFSLDRPRDYEDVRKGVVKYLKSYIQADGVAVAGKVDGKGFGRVMPDGSPEPLYFLVMRLKRRNRTLGHRHMKPFGKRKVPAHVRRGLVLD